jgi:hypothetical protein
VSAAKLPAAREGLARGGNLKSSRLTISADGIIPNLPLPLTLLGELRS